QLLLCEKNSRLDVAVENLSYEYSGFSLKIPNHLFSNGELKIKILVENKDLLFSTDKIINTQYKGFRKKDGFHIAFIGGMCMEKGSDTAYSMIKHAKNQIKFHIFGGIGVANLYLLESNNLVKTGWYTPEQLPILFKQYEIDLVCILSIWPETFCYTLSESLACSVPVIVTDIGALGERVRELDCGWVVPLESTGDDVLSLLENLWKNKQEYEEKLENIKGLSLKTTAQMAEEYRCIYDAYFKTGIVYDNYDANVIFQGHLLENDSLLLGENSNREVYEQLKIVENQLKSIQSSVTYRLLLKLSVLKIPFRPQFKKLVLNSYDLVKRIKGR
ncbi:MAG: glycosyltransferase, partial [Oscillospiraceae bacterium]